jgi:hypothetical protein
MNALLSMVDCVARSLSEATISNDGPRAEHTKGYNVLLLLLLYSSKALEPHYITPT